MAPLTATRAMFVEPSAGGAWPSIVRIVAWVGLGALALLALRGGGCFVGIFLLSGGGGIVEGAMAAVRRAERRRDLTRAGLGPVERQAVEESRELLERDDAGERMHPAVARELEALAAVAIELRALDGDDARTARAAVEHSFWTALPAAMVWYRRPGSKRAPFAERVAANPEPPEAAAIADRRRAAERLRDELREARGLPAGTPLERALAEAEERRRAREELDAQERL